MPPNLIETLNGVTVNAHLPLLDFAETASRHAIPGIEFDAGELSNAVESGKEDDVKAVLARLNVTPQVFGLPVDWRGPQATFDEGIAILPRLARAAQAFGCTRCCTWIPSSTDSNVNEFRQLAVSRFRNIASVLSDFGVSFGLEFVGPQTLREGPHAMGKNVFIWDIPGLQELISEINAPSDNVGILLDSFHWFCTAGTKADILSLDSKDIVHVHVNDAPDLALNLQMDFERLVPGDGVIELQLFIESLNSIGYKGPIAAEIFNKDLKNLPTDESVEKVSAAVKNLLTNA